MNAAERAFDQLTRLAGRWVGSGHGQYPTIEPFEFDEETSFSAEPEYPLLRYEQRAWLRPEREASHWELGVWRVTEDGAVELSTAQDSGRVEVLRGSIADEGEDGLRLELKSTYVGNDPRIVRTERVFTLRAGVLHYVKHMSTTTTPSPERLLHLEATLQREGGAR
jgi:hypothetical protein